MTIQQTYQILQHKQKRDTVIAACLLVLIMATIGLDFLYAQFQKTSFYVSESLLFSSFWLLFFPLLDIQLKLIQQTKKISISIFIASMITTIHLLAYPALVWLLSKIFYYHTFSYWQTFNFGLTEHSIKLTIIYGLSLLLIFAYKNRFGSHLPITEEKKLPQRSFIKSIIVSDTNNKKIIIEMVDVLYFSANAPYINIHHKTKKYLHAETLKSLEIQLDDNQFIRIHKSHIVNVCQVTSYQSRLNGDYDLTLTDDTILRVSRNYATIFKVRFEESHRLTIK